MSWRKWLRMRRMDGAGKRRGAIVGSACNRQQSADWQRFWVDEGRKIS